MSPRRAWRLAAALALVLSAPACSLLRDAPPPLSPAEAAAAGCYASTYGWANFGLEGSSADTVAHSWLVLYPRRNRSGTLDARFTGSPGPDGSPGRNQEQPARWWVQGDTVHVEWGDVDGLRLRAGLEEGGLRGWGTVPTGRVSPNDAGVWVPVECDWRMYAVRVPCEQVPRR